ncbi:MAG: hypothetical protein AMXMBFR53_38840 [Gemmatimonadota bacterium]
MTRDVLARKLDALRRYLDALRPHRGRSADDIADAPYEVERLLELIVQVAVDILAHELAERGTTPSSYRDAFVQAGAAGLIPRALALRLSEAAGLRNILVHLYETIDYEIVAASVGGALDDFQAFLDHYATRLKEAAGEGTEG